MRAYRFLTTERDALMRTMPNECIHWENFYHRPKWHKVQMKFHVKSYVELGKWAKQFRY